MRPEVLEFAIGVARLGRDYLAVKSPPLAEPPEDGDGGEHEPNTYGLPEGLPIARRLRKWFGKQLRALTGWLGKKANLPKRIPSLDRYTAPMAKSVTPTLARYWQASGEATQAALGLPRGGWDVKARHIAEAIDGAALAFCKSTNDTTAKTIEAARKELAREIREGILERHEAIPQLTARVRHVYEGLSKDHARLIAITESARAVNTAKILAAVDVPGIVGKRLLLASNACKICRSIKAREPKGGWLLLESMHDDGKGNADYSVAICPPFHPRCLCSLKLITESDAKSARPHPHPKPGKPHGAAPGSHGPGHVHGTGGQFAPGGGRQPGRGPKVDHDHAARQLAETHATDVAGAARYGRSGDFEYRYEHGPPVTRADHAHLARADAAGKVAVVVRSHQHQHVGNADAVRPHLDPGEPALPDRPGAVHHVSDGTLTMSRYEEGGKHVIVHHDSRDWSRGGKAGTRIDVVYRHRNPKSADRDFAESVRDATASGASTARLAAHPEHLPRVFSDHGEVKRNQVTTFRVLHHPED